MLLPTDLGRGTLATREARRPVHPNQQWRRERGCARCAAKTSATMYAPCEGMSYRCTRCRVDLQWNPDSRQFPVATTSPLVVSENQAVYVVETDAVGREGAGPRGKQVRASHAFSMRRSGLAEWQIGHLPRERRIVVRMRHNAEIVARRVDSV